MAKIIIATTGNQEVVAADKAANNASMGTLKGILADVSTHYESISNTIDNIGEKLDEVEQIAEYEGSNIPLTAAGAKAVTAALKDYAKVQKAAAAALAKAEKAVLKAVTAAEKGKIAPAAEPAEDDQEDGEGDGEE